jgi:hypothetical protein
LHPHKSWKGYYDKHNWPDVIKYQQETFLPAMEIHQERLVEYKMGAPTELVEKQLLPGVQKLVLV